MVVLARLLSPDEYGLLFLAIAVFGVVGVFSKLGIAKSGARYIAKYKENAPEQIPHILRVSFVFNLVVIGVVSLVLLLGHRHLALALDEPALVPFLLLGTLFVAFESISVFVRIILQGFEEIQLSATIHAIDRGSRLVFAVGFVVLGFGALGAFAGYILSVTVASVIGLWFIYRRFYSSIDAADSIQSGLRRRIGEYTVPLTATSSANVLDKRVDTILVGLFLTPVAVSYYTVGKQVVEFLEAPVSALGFTLSPSFGAQKADGNIEQAAKIYEEALIHSLLLYIPAAAGLMLIAEPAISLVFGDAYLGAVPVLQVLALYAILQSVTKITSNGLDFLGRAKERAIVKGATAVLNAGLNFVLIPVFGVVGAAVATVCTYSLYTAANVFIIHQEFDLQIGYLSRRIGHIVGITTVMAGIVFLNVEYITGWLSLAAIILLGVTVWGVLSVATGLLDIKRVASTL